MLYLKGIEIENVRCFGKTQQVDFTDGDGNIAQWSVILGNNGTGKTTLLRAIVAMLPTPQSFLHKRSHLDTSYRLAIHNGIRENWSLSHKDGSKPPRISLEIVEVEKPFLANQDVTAVLNYTTGEDADLGGLTHYDTRLFSPVYCFAYGANRKMGQSSLSGEKLLETSETLFNEEALLSNAGEYFLQIDYETAKKRKGSAEIDLVKSLLKTVLPSGVQDIRVSSKGKLIRTVEVKTSFGWTGINDLSLGYKTSIAWLVDFATKMMYYHDKSPSPFEEPAILVLDEIDLHMHPAWQREVIDSLTKIFKKTQFIVTAHSPLVAQSALEANLILLKRVGDHVEVDSDPNVIKGWRIDQVLTSSLFGLEQTRSKEVEKRIARRRKLIEKMATRTERENSELALLNAEIDQLPVGETQAEIDAMTLLRDFAARLKSTGRIANDQNH